ncbi:MAG: hypothetical protein ABIF71_04585 [Planctomycetota bacterium]
MAEMRRPELRIADCGLRIVGTGVCPFALSGADPPLGTPGTGSAPIPEIGNPQSAISQVRHWERRVRVIGHG